MNFTAGLKSLGINTTSWKAVAKARLASGVNKLTDVIPDEDTRAAFVKFTEAVKHNVANSQTVCVCVRVRVRAGACVPPPSTCIASESVRVHNLPARACACVRACVRMRVRCVSRK